MLKVSGFIAREPADGAPAQPDRQAKRQMIALQQLPDLLRRVHELEKRLGDKPKQAGPADTPGQE